MEEMQWLLKTRYRTSASLVVLVPPFSTAPSVDDGVRLLSDGEGLWRFCDVMRRVFSHVGVGFEELQAHGKDLRVQELQKLIVDRGLSS